MSYVGNTATQQAFTPAVDYFSGNGSTTAFTLSRPVASVAQVEAVINNVVQDPASAYTVSGNTITFTSAPSSGTNNIYVRYTSPITQVIAPGQGTVTAASFASGVLTPAAVSDQNNTSTGYFDLPAGTTAQRPGSPTYGMIRANTTTGFPEWYDSGTSSWINFNAAPPYSVEYLVIAGGGGGGRDRAGGGGAGGYRSSVSGEMSGGGSSAESPLSVTPGTQYTVTVGAGGSGSSDGAAAGTNGSNSVFASITSVGGGGGGSGSSPSNGAGVAGGSGGGARNNSGASGGSGTSGQGYAGGNNTTNDSGTGAGGGGAGAVGRNGSPETSNRGYGGAGVSSSINGSATVRAGGGGAGGGGSAGLGGSGGGGNGASDSVSGSAGTTNTGGGGGGGNNAQSIMGYAGGSGVVIIRYSGAQRGTGGTVTSSGGYTIHTFTTSGTYTA